MTGFSLTYSVTIEGEEVDGVKPYRTVMIIFDSDEASQESEADYYDDCRVKIQAWLDRHYPGERLATEGYDIEASGEPADNDDVIDMRT